MKQNRKILATLVLLSLLSASVPFRAGALTTVDFKTPEYYKAGGLDLNRAADAYALGYTGKGITVGETDFPVNFTSPELAPKTGSYDVEGVTAFDWAKLSHGTHVAGIMVAAKDDTGM